MPRKKKLAFSSEPIKGLRGNWKFIVDERATMTPEKIEAASRVIPIFRRAKGGDAPKVVDVLIREVEL